MPNESTARLCQLARSLTARTQVSLDLYLLSIGCRRWSCPQCAALAKAALIRRIRDAEPNRFITLTCRHEGPISDRLAEIKRGLQKLVPQLRKTGEFEYVRMLESCQDGYPHFHLLARCPYLPWAELKRLWSKYTTATIVDIRKAHGKSTAYIAKYIQKARDEEGTFGRQRISVSRGFWKDPDPLCELGAFVHHPEHPTLYAQERQNTTAFVTRGPTRWLMTEREPGDELPPELNPAEETLCPQLE